MIRRPPRSTLFPYTNALPISKRGYDLSALRARKFESADFQRFDLILAMDREHYSILSNMARPDRKSTRLNSSHSQISYAVFCLKKKKKNQNKRTRALP